ncbi:MAG: helix-turn-helix domain-containing protein [Patescibacteria group bacterium]|nr:helix-turn-helix domain-containing protein [Patescibacteria group bacterium]
MKNIAPIMKSIGLLESEISTYMAALEQGPSTVIDLSKKSKLSRQATYTAIDMLTERGLMSSVLRGKKRFYTAEPPTKLLAYAKRKDSELHDKVGDLENMLPELELQVGGERPIVKVFEGKEGLKAISQEIRASRAKENYELTDLDAMFKVLSEEDLKEVRASLEQAGQRRRVKALYSGNPAGSKEDEYHIFLSNADAGFEANIGIYGNKLTLMTFRGKMYSMLIDSEPLTKAMKVLFEHAHNGVKAARRKSGK